MLEVAVVQIGTQIRAKPQSDHHRCGGLVKSYPLPRAVTEFGCSTSHHVDVCWGSPKIDRA